MSRRRPPAGGELDFFAQESVIAPVREVAVPGESPGSAISIGTLTRTAKDVLEGAFPPLWIRGEVCDFKKHRNGHWYFCLRDESAQVRCVVWSRDQRRSKIPAAPDEGMQVVAFGQLTMYAARGDTQFAVTAMDAVGDGLWRKAFEEARARLAADGLLDPLLRRPLPRLPRRVAVVTSPDGAALHDIVAVIRRRCAMVEIVVVPTRVQGEGAPAEIRRALDRVARWAGADVVIIGRGGGSREDLWAFNDEQVARAVAACPIPIISAVGHEVDVTLCDLVADLRAATPSAAAEAAVPVLSEERARLATCAVALRTALIRRVDHARQNLRRTARELSLVATTSNGRRRAALNTLSGRLEALSPLATLRRGYAVALDGEGRTIMDAASVQAGAAVTVVLRDGRLETVVTDSTPAPPSSIG